MAGSSVIGALRVNLGIDSAQFSKGLASAQKELKAVGKKMQSIGQTLAVGVTAPLAGLGIGILKTAGDFEASMNRVQAATGASAAEFAALRDMARELGETTQFSAKDAADAQEMLAKNGVSTADILGGALSASLKLSAASGGELADSADLATAVMQSFGKTAGELDGVVDGITGVLLASKFGFEDYAQAVAQAGGVAGGVGVELEDFNAALAATSTLFASGSDAGTSLKTFLQRLVPQTSKAAAKMEELGLEFYDSTGSMKSMTEVAEELKTGLAGLSEEARNDALTEIFGTDAMRTAIGLAGQGAEGINRLNEAIGKASATEQAEARMKGFNGEMEKLRSALEGLALAIADSGLLQWATDMVAGLTEFVGKLSETSPELLKWGTIVAGVAAIVAPAVVAIGAVALALSAISLPVVAAVAGVAALGAGFAVFGSEIAAALSSAWATIQQTLGPPFTAMMEAAKNAFGSLGTAALEFVGSQVLANLEAAMHLVAGAFESVTFAIDVITSLLNGDLTGAFNAIVNLVTGLRWRIQLAFEAMIAPVRQVLTKLADEIWNALASLPGEMIALGKDIIRGLINGIKSMTASAVSAVTGVGQEIIDGISGIFQRNSPSRVMHDIGVDVMAGLRNGFTEGSAGAIDVATKTAETVNKAVQMATSVPAIGAKDAVNDASKSLLDFKSIGESIGSTLSGAFKQVVTGAKTVGDALRDIGMKFAEMAIDKGFQFLFSGFGDMLGGGGGGGGLLGGIGKALFGGLPGFANGGSFNVAGGSNKMDSQLAAFRVSAGETVSIGRDNDLGGAFNLQLVSRFDADGGFNTAVERASRPVARQEAHGAVKGYDRTMQGGALRTRIDEMDYRG